MKRRAAFSSGANSFGSAGAPGSTLTTALPISVPYCPLVTDNVLYHAQILIAGKTFPGEVFRRGCVAAVTLSRESGHRRARSCQLRNWIDHHLAARGFAARSK